MDCNKAGRLMMSYMDKNIAEEEEISLSLHVSKCDTCREEFAIYQEIEKDFKVDKDYLSESEQTPVVSTPDFECVIMDKISKLSERAERQFKLIFGAYTAVFSFLVVIVLLNVNINYADMALTLSNALQITIFTLINVLQEIFYQFGNYAFILQYYAALILVGLVLLYFFVRIREKIRLRVTN